MSLLLGIDIGTSGVKTLLVDPKGDIIASVTVEYPLSSPRPGWFEQDAEGWYQAVVQSVRETLARAGVEGSSVASVGLSGQMHGAVLLDGNGRVLRPAILWCDQRTAAECGEITRLVGADELVRITCNPVLTGFQAPKVIWTRNHEPDVYSRIRHVLLPKDYIRYRLTGELATEVSDASGTSFLDVPNRRWSPEILDALDIPHGWLPEVHESTVPSAIVSAAGAAETGLATGTSVVGGGGDQAAGGVGNGIVEPGILSSTIGSSGVVFAFAETPAYDPKLRVHTFCHAVPGKWHVMGVMLSAGQSLQWLRNTLLMEGYEAMNEMAGKAPAGSEGLLFLPYLAGERTPYPDPDASGVFFGLTLRHTTDHLIRSVMEGVAYGLRDSFEILEEMGIPAEQVRASGGGARSSLWRQIQADITGRAHVTINAGEGPAFGAALLAGVGVNVWPDVETACRETIRVVEETKPTAANRSVYSAFYGVYRSLYPVLKDRFAENASIVREMAPEGT